jgi:hypothetical protein
VDGESGFGRQLADALFTLQNLPNRKLRLLLPDSIEQVLNDDFEWHHDEIQRELDHLVVQAHDALYDQSRIPDQQDKATLFSTDTSIFQLIPRSKVLQIPNEALVYLAKQLFGKAQRRYIRKFYPHVARSTGNYCGAPLDSRDLHLRTCRMNNVNHEKHKAVRFWFKDFVKQAHIQTAPTPPISETSQLHPTKPLAGDLMLVDVSLRQAGRDGQCGVIDFSIITPAAEHRHHPSQKHRSCIQPNHWQVILCMWKCHFVRREETVNVVSLTSVSSHRLPNLIVQAQQRNPFMLPKLGRTRRYSSTFRRTRTWTTYTSSRLLSRVEENWE